MNILTYIVLYDISGEMVRIINRKFKFQIVLFNRIGSVKNFDLCLIMYDFITGLDNQICVNFMSCASSLL